MAFFIDINSFFIFLISSVLVFSLIYYFNYVDDESMHDSKNCTVSIIVNVLISVIIGIILSSIYSYTLSPGREVLLENNQFGVNIES